MKSAKELDGATVCVLPGTTTELNVADYFRATGMKMKPVVIENTAELAKTFFAGSGAVFQRSCQAFNSVSDARNAHNGAFRVLPAFKYHGKP